jgi:hypothetical protein
MANTFYAATAIKYGERKEDGSQDGKYESKSFEPGDKVEGLSADTMKDLWRAGALTREAPKQEESDEDEDESNDNEGDKESDTPKPTKTAPAKATPQPPK